MRNRGCSFLLDLEENGNTHQKKEIKKNDNDSGRLDAI